eukprot:TRINITY_DN1700_c0_g1_i1.p1 TRINITY_DN1700_c0_g1~~TRINITY_DN1700_c0_g1_i1.p1  ORF type:complete len:330 (+),score=30.42 TRINITY_DN1700_c0_g1_i1:24-1013(+)
MAGLFFPKEKFHTGLFPSGSSLSQGWQGEVPEVLRDRVRKRLGSSLSELVRNFSTIHQEDNERKWQEAEVFVAEFGEMMDFGGYTLLSEHMWQFSYEGGSNSGWQILHDVLESSEILDKWVQSKVTSGIPAFSKRVLIWTRGTENIKERGLFLQAKLELIFSRIFLKPVINLVKGTQPSYEIRDTVITRKSLADVLPKATTAMRHFFTEVQLEEPLFKEVILLYPSPQDPQKFVLKGYFDISAKDLHTTLPSQMLKFRPSIFSKTILALMFLYGLLSLFTEYSLSQSLVSLFAMIFCRFLYVIKGHTDIAETSADACGSLLYSKVSNGN